MSLLTLLPADLQYPFPLSLTEKLFVFWSHRYGYGCIFLVSFFSDKAHHYQIILNEGALATRQLPDLRN